MTTGSLSDAHLTGLTAALDGRYRLERELGAGGMASVWLAEDVRHRRRVAVKVLHPELSSVIGPERFLKEVELTASLQHPHILPLFDSGSAEGLLYYVMPFVDGETLRARLERERQLPIVDALRIATEVADALDYAHRHGVIHRDIKPENILLHDGHVVVADFGIALAVQSAGGARMTQTGLSLGTPQYMAPEQAMGERTIDARADIYALGVVTYEMLAGQPPFTGPNVQAIIARVLTGEPPRPGTHRRSVPAHVDAAVVTALAMLPADRFATAASFAAALAGTASPRPVPRGARGERPADRAVAGSRWRLAAGAAAGVLLVAAGAFWLGGRLRAADAPPVAFGRATRLTWDPGLEVHPALSPDGRAVAFTAGTSTDTRIFVRQLSGGRAVRLTDDTTAVQAGPTWSPDGSRVLFLARGTVFSAPAGGGSARQEVPARGGETVMSAAWAPDGRHIAYTVGDSLLVHAPDGVTRLVARMPEPTSCAWSPDGQRIACTSGNARYLTVGPQFGNLSPNRIVICRVSDGATVAVSDSTSINVSPLWSPDGRWLYYVSNRDGRGDIYAQHLGRDGALSGPAQRLTVGLGAQSISSSGDGSRFAYAVYVATANFWAVPLPSGGTVSVASATPVTTGDQVTENAFASRDGKWLIHDSNVSGYSNLYRVRLVDGLAAPEAAERLTTGEADDFFPEPSPDNRAVAFHSWRSGSRDVWVQPLDGRAVERVTASPEHEWLVSWSPDGRALAYEAFRDYAAEHSIWVVRRGATGAWEAPARRLTPGQYPAWSPDGRWIVYTRGAEGSLMVAPADSGASRVVLDATRPGMPGAETPRWSADSRTVYFKSHDARGAAAIWSIPLAGGSPRLVVRFDDPARPSYRPGWTLGPRHAYFPVDDRQSDVWVMDAGTR